MTEVLEAAVTPEIVVVPVCYDRPGPAASLLREALSEALATGAGHLIADLSACDYLDAEGVGILLEAHRRCWTSERRFSISGVSVRVERILALSGLTRVLEIVDLPDPLP